MIKNNMTKQNSSNIESSKEDMADRKIFLYSKLLSKYNLKSKVAYIFDEYGEYKTLIKEEIDEQVDFLANAIANQVSLNKKRQIRIFSVLRSSHESFILMLASAKMGAHHCICFEELSEKAIQLRVKIFDPDIILFKKRIEIKVKKSVFKSFPKVPLMMLDLQNFPNDNSEYLKKEFIEYPYSTNSALFTLFTSGSTGKPKAIVHNASSYINYSEFTTSYFFGLNKHSIMFTATDAGWINGHTYSLYGPLINESMVVIHENLKSLSNPNYLLNLLDEIKVTCFYSSVTLLRLIKNESINSNAKLSKNQLQNLDRIGSCGEPLAHDVGAWALDFFKPNKKIIVNTYFQTETGGILVAPREEDGLPTNFSSVGKPRKELGLIFAKELFSKNTLINKEIDPDEIFITKKWEGLFQEVISDRKTNYWVGKNFFRLNDIGYLDKEGFLYIGGRSDDVINIAGHRISSSEIESVCLKIPEIHEACAVAKKDNILGNVPVLFISTKVNNQKEIYRKVLNLINTNLSPSHQPSEIIFFRNLPKTRSGKIMRRIMKDLVNNLFINENSDYSTLANYDEFRKSEDNFFCEILEKSANSKKQFYLKEFCRNNFVNFKYPYLFNVFISKIVEVNLRLNNEFNPKKIIIKIVNNSKEFFYESFDLSEKFSLLEINNFLKESSFKSELCMSEISGLIIKFIINKDKNITYLMKNINREDLQFSFNEIIRGIKIKNSVDLSKIIFCSNDNKIKEDSSQNILGSVLNSKENQNSKSCFKCKTTLSKLAQERDVSISEVFFLSVINHNGESKLICDICFRGW